MQQMAMREKMLKRAIVEWSWFVLGGGEVGGEVGWRLDGGGRGCDATG